MIFQRTIQNVNRAKDIALILMKYGFEEVITHTALKKIIGRSPKSVLRRHDPQFTDRSTEERIRMAIEELGATFVKLAQVISNRPDVISPKLIKEFEKLQNQVHPESYETIIAAIEKELQLGVNTLFAYVEKTPLGSASIGQVHRARLRNGQEVVVKVQRPKVSEQVRKDLDIIKEIVRLSEGYFRKKGVLNPLDIVETFEKVMLKELDYNTEARNMDQFRKFYEKNTDFYVPKVYKDISTKKILVQEYVKGCKITDVARLHAWGIDPQNIAERGMEIYMSQIFEHGFFHADPHPGNILIQETGRICLIDYGMVGKLSTRDKFNFAGVFINMAQRNPQRMARSLMQLALDSDVKNVKKLEADLSELIEDYVMLDVSETNINEFAISLQSIIYEYKLQVPPSVFVILRSFTILEGIGKTISPSFQFYEFLKPYGAKIIREQFSFEQLKKNTISTAMQLSYFLKQLPYDAQDITTQIAKGKLNIKIEQQGHQQYLEKLDLIANRSIMAFLIVGLLIAASLLMNVKFSSGLTTASGVPIFSIIGYVVAGFLFLILMITILRRGRL